nr:response regulator [Gemmatimonadales bacterium]
MTKPVVLVVDDEKLIRVWLQAHLGGAGYEVKLAESATAARESFERSPPDAALLDLKLPDGEGM